MQSEEESFIKLVDAFTQATGVPVTILNESLDDVQPKAPVVANVCSGRESAAGAMRMAERQAKRMYR